jgi:hypothetical protein
VLFLLFAVVSVQQCIAQNTNSPASKTFLCDLVFQGQQESKGCSHKYVNDQIFKTAYGNGMAITVGADNYSQYMRVTVVIVNNSSTPVDVMPNSFLVQVSTPKTKTLHYVPAEKIARAEEQHAHTKNSLSILLAGFANGMNSVAAANSRQQSTTESTTNGTFNASSSNGSYVNGSYNGTATSTTSSPDYAAQQRADEQNRGTIAAVAAANARRNASTSSANAMMLQTALSGNTIAPGHNIGGYVYFDGDKKADTVTIQIPIADAVYEFKFSFD